MKTLQIPHARQNSKQTLRLYSMARSGLKSPPVIEIIQVWEDIA